MAVEYGGGGAPGGHRLSPLDHAAAAGVAATGRNSLVQVTWIHDDPIDMAGLHSFCRNLANGPLGRRIERSFVPCARPRWVRDTVGRPLTIDPPALRTQIDRWVDHRAAQPIDPWRGPGWHLALLPLHDGGAAVTLVASHALVDGIGLAIAVVAATTGQVRDLACADPGSRGVARTLVADVGSVLRSIPVAGRALVAAIGQMRTRLESTTPTRAAPGPVHAPAVAAGDHEPVERVDTWAVVHVDVAAVTAEAHARGGTATTLLCGVAAQLAASLGWVNPTTRAATIALSVNQRTSQTDSRANALTEVEIDVVPTSMIDDLTGVRGDIRAALSESARIPHRFDSVLPVIPFIPKRLLGALIEAPTDRSRPVTTCAGLGILDPAAYRPDGTAATESWFRLTWNELGARTPRPRREYLYVGWTGTDTEFAVFAATNLPMPARTPWRDVIRDALATYSLAPTARPGRLREPQA